ncbi:hypothetical protein D3C77_517730 [compost metagenome]
MLDKQSQQLKFLGCERDALLLYQYFPCRQIYFKTSIVQNCSAAFLPRTGTPQYGFHSGNNLSNGGCLDNIIVAAKRQTSNLVHIITARAQK